MVKIKKVSLKIKKKRWVVYVPELKDKGGASWGKNKRRSFKELRRSCKTCFRRYGRMWEAII